MKNINYSQLYQKLTKGLSPKTKDIFDRRFGVGRNGRAKDPETLESIGRSLGITRERVRQIEEAGFNYIRKNHQNILAETHADLADYFGERGGVKKEEGLLEELGRSKAQASQKPYVLFFLTIGEQFSKICEKKDHYYFWSNMPNAQQRSRETLNGLVSQMKKIGKPISQKDFYVKIAQPQGLSEVAALSWLEISKKIQPNKEGFLGLTEWPEINPRGVKDKAFLVFKKQGKPLHFKDVAQLIDKFDYNLPNLSVGSQGKKTYSQTVHNELIKDPRFVLVGRGTYALAEWGYVPGTIKDIITRILKDKNEPVNKEQVVKEVLAQRLVAKNTVLMNLNNKKYFSKDQNNRYFFTS